jgi:F0F1-type ATP synthase assembly protein I
MAIIYSSKHEFHFHLLTLTLIFVLILTNTFITVKEWGRWGVDTPIVLGSLSLIILFIYAMCVAATHAHIKCPKEKFESSSKPLFNLTGYSSKGYEQVPLSYNDEAEDNA